MTHTISSTHGIKPGIKTLEFDDPAVQYGAGGLFETMRVEQGGIHLFGLHMDRLERSASFWEIPLPCDRRRLLQAVRSEVAALGRKHARLRITAGLDPASLNSDATGPLGRIFVNAAPLPRGYRKPLRQRPRLRAMIFRDFVISTSNPWTGHKSTQYYPYWEARRRARRYGFDEAILLNERGEVVEASAFNVFWILAGRVYTPSLESGALPGIFAEWLAPVARKHNVWVEAVRAHPEELESAEAVFLTNSLGEIISVGNLDGRALPGLTEHPITAKLTALCEEMSAGRCDINLEKLDLKSL